MDRLDEYLVGKLVEGKTSLQRDIVFHANGDHWEDNEGHTFADIKTASKTGNYYDVVIIPRHDDSALLGNNGRYAENLKNIKCNYLIDNDGYLLVRLKRGMDRETGKAPDHDYGWEVAQAVCDINKGKEGGYQTFFWGSFINDTELTVSQLDKFFKNNDINHFICGTTKGKMDGRVRYNLFEILPGGKHGYIRKPFRVESLANDYGVPPSSGSNWLAMF